MKFCKWVVWILIALAVILILLSGICLLFQFDISGINKISYFHAANSLLLLSIAIYLVTGKLCHCCDKSKDEK